MKHTIAGLVIVASLAVTGASAVEAKGCLKGAAVGAVAGHYMHHHAILGAVAGCWVGHHMAVEKEKQDKARQQQHPPSQQNPPQHAI